MLISGRFAKCPEQREIKRRAHRLLSHGPCELDIRGELRTIAFHFPCEESLQIGALVRADLVVDHPAGAGRVDEAAVDSHVAQLPGAHSAQLPLAAGSPM